VIAADRWLNRRSRLLKRCDEASTQAAIVSKTIDINPVVRRIRVDLETDLAPLLTLMLEANPSILVEAGPLRSH